MMLVEETSVPADVLPVAGFKAHLRLGSGFSDDAVQDAVLEGFLRAALAAIEARTGKVLLQRDFSWTLTMWRDARGQALPVAPVTGLVELVLTDRLGDVEVVDPTLYRLAQDIQRPKLVPTGFVLPSVPLGGSVEVTFTAGYAADWAGLPEDLAQAVLLLAAHYYEFRHETQLGEGCMPFGVASLIERYKTVRLLGGGGS
ncbi:MAG: hypothetical protein QGI08_14340 [Paracoccaceae bacterium]|jgi:uncharacterized phiE125 gp8 family phage protein|nr:hypothetical protein [Paracoccaceae bacterium]MDP7186897.1 hypothetical protein [Paracoccaceae bacterium]